LPKAQKTLIDPEPQINDLRSYLQNKINQVQDRSRPEELEKEIFSGVGVQRNVDKDSLDGQYKFKASTLTHIAELKRTGYEKIEN
jgi:hypothetical protein